MGTPSQRLDAGNLPPYSGRMPDSFAETTVRRPTAFLTAEQLGGRKTIGRQVRSDAELARAVELGLPTAAIDALRKLFTTSRPKGTITSTPMMMAMLQKATSRRSTVAPRRARGALALPVPGVMAVLSMGEPAGRAHCRYTARGIPGVT